jgi:hypothetical protein
VWHQLAQHPNDYVYTWAGRVATAWAVQTTTDKQRTNKKRKAKKGKEERRGDEGKEQNFAPGIPGKNAVKKRVQYVSPAAAAAAAAAVPLLLFTPPWGNSTLTFLLVTYTSAITPTRIRSAFGIAPRVYGRPRQ